MGVIGTFSLQISVCVFLTLTAKRKRRVTAIVGEFCPSVCPSVRPFVHMVRVVREKVSIRGLPDIKDEWSRKSCPVV